MEHLNILGTLATSDRVLSAAATLGIMALFGVYDLPLKAANILKGLIALFLCGLATQQWTGLKLAEVFTMLAMSGAVVVCVRLLLYMLEIRRISTSPVERARILAIGSEEETKRALGLLWQTHYGLDLEITMDAGTVDEPTGAAQVKEAIRKQRLDEVVFCAKDLSSQRIIRMLEQLQNRGDLQHAQPASNSSSAPAPRKAWDLSILRDHAVDSSSAKRRRRTMDLLVSLFLRIRYPWIGSWRPRSVSSEPLPGAIGQALGWAM